MFDNSLRVKVFYVKNHTTNENIRLLTDGSPNSNTFNIEDISTFQSEYLAKNRSRTKDLTHLSTFLQRDKIDDFSEPQNHNMNEVKTSQSIFLGKEDRNLKNDSFIEMFSNDKLNLKTKDRLFGNE